MPNAMLKACVKQSVALAVSTPPLDAPTLRPTPVLSLGSLFWVLPSLPSRCLYTKPLRASASNEQVVVAA